MHFTLVTAIAVLAHATQSFGAPIPASYEIQDLSARSDAKDNWKKAVQGIAGSIPDAALKVPVKGNVASVVQKAMAVAKAGSSPSSNTQHAPRLPATAPGPAQPAPLTKKKSNLFQPPSPAPASSKKSKSIAEQAQDAKSITGQAMKAFKKSSKRDIIPDLEVRSDPKDNWKKAIQGVAASIPDAALKVPVKGNMASVVQKAMAVAKAGSSPSSNTQHAPRLPATAPGPAQPAPLTKKKSSLFQPPSPAPASSKKSKSIAEQAQDAKSITGQAMKAFKKSSKRDIMPDLEARHLEIDELD